ncbi:MAG: class I SAM-dependent methyltransferase [Pseudomonadales bacterium]|nr:class I SAM-dependent methyltransferase [Pseudomonadales bacterium]
MSTSSPKPWSKQTLTNKWDKRYQNATRPGLPCNILSAFSQLIPQQGRALDLACGLGANSLYLAGLGLDTYAWDISSVALRQLNLFAKEQQLSITTQVHDIEKNPPEESSFDLIVVSRFLYRPICESISKALKPGGVLFYQTFIQDKVSSAGPSDNQYRLSQNELLTLFPNLSVMVYQEVGSHSQRFTDQAQKLDSDTAMLVAKKTS